LPLCFWSCMKFSFRGHSWGFIPSFGNPFPFPRVESSWAWQFFNHRYLESWDHLDFDALTI
jgi:hypothetical protein